MGLFDKFKKSHYISRLTKEQQDELFNELNTVLKKQGYDAKRFNVFNDSMSIEVSSTKTLYITDYDIRCIRSYFYTVCDETTMQILNNVYFKFMTNIFGQKYFENCLKNNKIGYLRMKYFSRLPKEQIKQLFFVCNDSLSEKDYKDCGYNFYAKLKNTFIEMGYPLNVHNEDYSIDENKKAKLDKLLEKVSSPVKSMKMNDFEIFSVIGKNEEGENTDLKFFGGPIYYLHKFMIERFGQEYVEDCESYFNYLYEHSYCKLEKDYANNYLNELYKACDALKNNENNKELEK